jgi:hypothetical protein
MGSTVHGFGPATCATCDSEPPINEGFRNFLQNSSISKLGGTKLNILQQNVKVQFLGPISLKKNK